MSQEEPDYLQGLKECTVTVACCLLIGVGPFVLFPQGDYLTGSITTFFGSAGIIICLYDFIIKPWQKNRNTLPIIGKGDSK